MTVLTNSLIFLALWSQIYGKSRLLLDEKREDCTKGGAKYVDFSKVEYEYVNDSTYYMNGVLKFDEKVQSPWKVHYYIEKYERGKWHTAIIDRVIPDFCKVIADKSKPWAVVVNYMRRKECPYEAGHTEKFNMVHIKESTLPDFVDWQLMGRYRAVIVSYFKKSDGTIFEECLRTYFEIVPI